MTDFRTLIDTVRDKTDLVALIGQQVQLEPAGSVLKGSSPFRPDKTPSFIVWPKTQTWRDFSGGSNDGGDCFDYVRRRDGVEFWPALCLLAAEAGISVPGQTDDPVLQAELDQLLERRRIEKVLAEAADYYHSGLPTKIREQWYHGHYGFTDETIDRLKLGWADGHLYDHLTKTMGFSREDALGSGLFVLTRGGLVKDFFTDRLVFPYWRGGHVVYFIARATEHTSDEPWEQAKYKKLLTHSERHAYVSTYVVNDTFYNEDAARGAKEVLITEGVTDCISAMQAGIACISPVTTRFRKKDQKKLIALTERAERIVICNDAEESGAGDAGALDTAKALHAAGRNIRLARIPRPEGCDKIDLNEFLKAAGPEALQRVIADARSLPHFLLEALPPDTPKDELGPHLKPILALVPKDDPLQQAAIIDVLEARFGLDRELATTLVKEGAIHTSSGTAPNAGTDIKGAVFAEHDHYYTLGRQEEPIVISSFAFHLKRIIQAPKGPVYACDLHTRIGTVIRDKRFPRSAWSSARSLIRHLDERGLTWTGTDNNVQAVLTLLDKQAAPTAEGFTAAGYAEVNGTPIYVFPSGVLDAGGMRSVQDAFHVDTGDPLTPRLRPLEVPDPAVETAIAALVLPKLLELNAPQVVLPMVGWFFATPLKPRFMELLGHFPFLMVWGTQGTGKTALTREIFWPLFGVRATEPFSTTETDFAQIRLFSSTTSVPVFVDEYKPSDMPRQRRDRLHRMLRRLYTGETENRGQADQSVNSYELSAPLCVAGEAAPIESAIVERMVSAAPSKDALLKNRRYVDNFHALRVADLGTLHTGIVRHLLGRDTEADLRIATRAVDDGLQGRTIPPRMRDNLIAVVCGLVHYEGYADSLGIALPRIDVRTLIDSQCEELLDGNGYAVKSGADHFLEILSSLAVSRHIVDGKQFTYTNQHLAIHLPSCHSAYAEHIRRTNYVGETLTQKALLRQLRENADDPEGYTVEIGRMVCFNGARDRRRATIIDLKIAKAQLEVDDFPQDTSDYPTGGAGWQAWRN